MPVLHMRRPLSKLIACTVSALVAVMTRDARAQTAGADAGAQVCAPIVRQLAAAQKDAEEAHREAASVERRAALCQSDLTSSQGELASTNARAKESAEATLQCEQSKKHLCAATAAFADEIARGHVKGASETGCVTSEQQRKLDDVVNGWNATATLLGQVAAYENGEAASLPPPRGGFTPGERALQRILRGGQGRAFHRRLLIEAIELIAPRTWAKVREGGSAAIESWFAEGSALAPDLVKEAQHARGAPGPAGPPLTAALHLVNAFQQAARCGVPADRGECLRAQQLEQLLESSGSLVVRRRIEEIWATECTTLRPEAVKAWVEEFPGAHLADATNPWAEIGHDAYAKLFACYLDDASEHTPFGTWLKEHLPPATSLDAERLKRVDLIRDQWQDGSRQAACTRAVRAMQTLVLPSTCAVPVGDFRPALSEWAQASAKLDDADIPLAMCAQFASLLWHGKAASIDGSFAHPPSLDEMVVAAPTPPTPMWRLRAHCEERRGRTDRFEMEVSELAGMARAFGDGVDQEPFRVDPQTLRPVELVQYEAVQGAGPWLAHVAKGKDACTTVGMSKERCGECAKLAPGAVYDCALVARLEQTWEQRTRFLVGALAALAMFLLGATWARRLVRARRTFAAWSQDTVSFFDGIGLAGRRDRWRALFPSRYDAIFLALPSDAAWERWGTTAAVVRAPPGARVRERDVNHAAFVARRAGASVVLLEHDDDAAPDLSAVRAMLEWAAKGGERALQILPIGVSRARWSKSAQDVLELVEESSLRGNAFELRGRIASSTQFFNRERLVSGLLASAQAGHWMVVTGLRRFGKSSLVLEIVRRLPGPSAYVDVTGFDHEIAHGSDPALAADAILRFVCLRLHEAACARWPSASFPPPPAEGAALDTANLTQWFRALSREARVACGHSVPLLVVLDELEQALGVGAERLAHALDVLAIVIGRLKSAVGDAAMPDAGSPIAVFLTSALHPLLWAPLRTLAHQSIMGSFQRVCVPCLDAEAATTMMRSLGGRQGVRFTDEALARLVEESQGVPLLLRRLGASVLELYDAERARQGSLGAVEIGNEGTNEAIERESREGSPLRVWVETEIAARNTVTGALLRKLARDEMVDVVALRALAKKRIADEFVRTGIAATLPSYEVARRAEEAAHVMVSLLDESGLVTPHGDLTAPDGYALPDGAIRRVLRRQPASTGTLTAEPIVDTEPSE